MLDQLALFGHHFVQLLELMLEMSNVRFELFEALGSFVSHGNHIAAIFSKVEPVTETYWLFVWFVYFVVQNFSCRFQSQLENPPPT